MRLGCCFLKPFNMKEDNPCLIGSNLMQSQPEAEGMDKTKGQMTLTSLCSELQQGCLERKTPALLSTRPHTNSTGKGQLRCNQVLPNRRGDQVALL